jgi:hypothetical protein
MRCIFCLDLEPPSGFTDEHVFPDAVGGTLIVRNVCKSCNDRLGHSVDSAITNHALVQVKRQALGLAGKSGRVPNPFGHAVMADDPQQKLRLSIDWAKPDSVGIYAIPSVERTMTGPGEGSLQVRIDASDLHRLRDIINTALVRAGAPPLSAEAVNDLTLNEALNVQPRVNVQLSVDISKYQRGLMKIAYELACLWLGESYADDPTASRIRQFIFDDELPLDPSTKHAVRGNMRMAPSEPLLPFWPHERDHLMACMVEHGGRLGMVVSFLGILDAAIGITDAPHSYPNRQQRFISIDPRTGLKRECRFEEEAARVDPHLADAG